MTGDMNGRLLTLLAILALTHLCGCASSTADAADAERAEHCSVVAAVLSASSESDSRKRVSRQLTGSVRRLSSQEIEVIGLEKGAELETDGVQKAGGPNLRLVCSTIASRGQITNRLGANGGMQLTIPAYSKDHNFAAVDVTRNSAVSIPKFGCRNGEEYGTSETTRHLLSKSDGRWRIISSAFLGGGAAVQCLIED